MTTPRFIVAIGLTIVLTVSSSVSAEDKQRPAAGWYEVIPHLGPLLHPTFEQPVVAKSADGSAVYSQSAHYDMATGLIRSFKLTIARDPGFKKQFSAEALKDVAVEHQMGKRSIWMWKDDRKLVIPLGDDKAAIFELDANSEKLPLFEYAKKLELKRIANALENPPRTEFAPTLETFKVLAKGATVQSLSDWCGQPTKYEPLGKQDERRARWSYALKDKSTVAVVTAAGRIESIVHETDGKSVELLK
jgi:hypothetical protein